MRAELSFDKLFGDMLRDYEKMAGQAGAVAREALEEQQKQLYQAYYDGLARHDDNGDALDSLEIDPIVQDGNIFYGKVGSSYEKNKPGFLHARFQEFGATRKNGVVTFRRDPWRAPADAKIKSMAKRIAIEVMRRRMK